MDPTQGMGINNKEPHASYPSHAKRLFLETDKNLFKTKFQKYFVLD